MTKYSAKRLAKWAAVVWIVFLAAPPDIWALLALGTSIYVYLRYLR